MVRLKTLAAAVMLCVATPAMADKFFAVTPSGATEEVFPDRPSAVVGALSSKCIDSKWTVISSTPNEVVCEAPLNMGQSILGQLMLGNSYSTPPRRFFRFNIAEINGVSRVQASGWMELQMAFGQMKRTDFSGPEFHNGMMNFLSSAGGKFPQGTTFPNHASMGIKGVDVPRGKVVGLRITSFELVSAASSAGAQIDDIIVRVAGKQFKNLGEFLDATAKAAETPTYVIDVERTGKPVKLTLARQFRPTFAEAVVASPTSPSPLTPTAGNSSVADELEKLVKLKAAGVLTEAEFEDQKRKLLAR